MAWGGGGLLLRHSSGCFLGRHYKLLGWVNRRADEDLNEVLEVEFRTGCCCWILVGASWIRNSSEGRGTGRILIVSVVKCDSETLPVVSLRKVHAGHLIFSRSIGSVCLQSSCSHRFFVRVTVLVPTLSSIVLYIPLFVTLIINAAHLKYPSIRVDSITFMESRATQSLQ